MMKSIFAKRKPGRPKTGTTRMYGARLSEELVTKIDVWANKNDLSRSEAIRQLIEVALNKGRT
ncbi:hypothetical protein DK847_14680 [Aestuariivirga litoralis]|uniref:Ribbon-helix-helix protein CopG domain-containing protein n=1 Tax=Aestuariivirga litoralis TaxID=2650924 RepID=A0A2W2BKI7_9HYPH|nr:hypothetical protein DK847_14680 [Aestuariivirga litoralis]